ncbi:type IV pilus assembly protein PilM [Fontibacillus solani]|uniref:Type IV pilus assembly protein PilM n=1 Tax=Fontibacillus solani TaxID=1572857 RepID=A0A7W3SQ88_9BACL|nr:pilus assembly protein PilM [Fontibacillus solani]MBA9084226.1 type IV pilus assembly protein PilM [Fontibacillus solani]
MLAVNKHMGLTIDPSGIRYVTVKKKKEWEVEKYGFFPFTEAVTDGEKFYASNELREQLKAWVKSEKIYGTAVTLSMPTSHIIIRKLQVGTVNARELDQLVDLEVETTLHLPFADPVYDYLAATSTEDSTEVLVYASRHNWIEQCNELLNDVGLKVKTAELSSMALARTIQEVLNEPLEDTMLLHLDKESTEVYLFHNDLPVFMRVLNEYSHQEVIEKGLTPELIGSINAELSRLLNFYQYSIRNGESRITKVVVSGERRGQENLLSEFREEQPDIQVDVFDFDAIDYIVPFGLAIRERGSKSVNLLPESTPIKTSIPLTFVAIGLAWILCLGVILTLYMMNQSDIKDHESELAALKETASGLELQISELSKDKYTDPTKFIEFVNKHKMFAKDVWWQLDSRLPISEELEASNLTSMEYTYLLKETDSLKVQVSFHEFHEIAKYLIELRKISFVEDVKLESFTPDTVNEGDRWIGTYKIQWKNDLNDTGQKEGEYADG